MIVTIIVETLGDDVYLTDLVSAHQDWPELRAYGVISSLFVVYIIYLLLYVNSTSFQIDTVNFCWFL